MQGQTYDIEKQKGIIWAPQKDKNGNIPHSWLRMNEVKYGDRIFHYLKGEIVAVSVAVSDCEEGKKPEYINSFEQGVDIGFIVKLRYFRLEYPLSIRKHFSEIKGFLPLRYSPFQQNGSGNLGYLYPCNEELTIKILDLISEENLTEIRDYKFDSLGDSKQNQLLGIVKETEAEAKRKIRIGQEKFKKILVQLWNHKCALCDVKIAALLRASHAKPWRDCSDKERLNPYNGILLCCNHDALFDRGFISFDEKGKICISKQIPKEQFLVYGIKTDSQISCYPENIIFFNWHRKHIFIEL